MLAEINGLHLFYEERGDPGAEPVVFLHGFPLDHRMWRHQLDCFTRSFRCIAPDLRGHGATRDAGAPAQPGQVAIAGMADDVAALLDHLRIARATVCGLSMGGYIAFALWRAHPGRIARLILADTKAAADTEEARANRYRLAELVLARGARAAADAMLPRLVAPEHLAGAVGRDLRAVIERASPAQIAVTLHALAARPDSTGLLATLTAPTLIVVGELDAITPLADAEVMRRGAPGAQALAVIPGAGHMSPLENPDAFNAAMAAFLGA